MTNKDNKHAEEPKLAEKLRKAVWSRTKDGPKGWEAYWHEKGKNEGYRLGYENALKAQWHPYDKDNKETHPPKDGRYLIRKTTGQYGIVFDCGDWNGENFLINKDLAHCVVTHWQSITPPQEEGDSE